MPDKELLHILLADDDEDDRFFFARAVKKLATPADFVCVEDGEKLMEYLSANTDQLPDILFIDINMPRKYGYECLIEIKANDALKNLTVVLYSTVLQDSMADLLYKSGAHYYFRKGDFPELVKSLEFILSMLVENDFRRPSREHFVVDEI